MACIASAVGTRRSATPAPLVYLGQAIQKTKGDDMSSTIITAIISLMVGGSLGATMMAFFAGASHLDK